MPEVNKAEVAVATEAKCDAFDKFTYLCIGAVVAIVIICIIFAPYV